MLIKKIILMFLFLALVNFNNIKALSAEDNVITVYCDKDIGKINKMIFGNNIIAYDPMTYEDWAKEYYGYSDYGAGIWDPKWNESVKEVIDLAKEAGISIVRFPGGCGTHHYNWKNAVGKNREHFLYGIDEFLKTCEEIGAEVVITVSYFTGDEKDAADLVEYLNGKADQALIKELIAHGSSFKAKQYDKLFERYVKNEDGSLNWANFRALNGHIKPYNVKYFEIGNEVWHGDHRLVKAITATQYAEKYLLYYKSMKAVDASIEIGAILQSFSPWNKIVIEQIKDNADFFVRHSYPHPESFGIDTEEIIRDNLLAFQVKYLSSYCEDLELIAHNSGEKNIPLAISEFNGEYPFKKMSLRHSLGGALLIGEMLDGYIKLKDKLLFCNYWQFCNSHWGMVANGFDGTYKTLYNPYYKRPNYHVFEMYHKHFGDVLINADVKCDSYDVSQYRTFKQRIKDFITRGIISGGNLLGGKWDIEEFRGANVIEKAGILEINFVEPKEFNYYHAVKTAKVEPGIYYKLSGYIKTENLNDPMGVCLEVQDSRGWNATKSAASTDKITGTSDWTYVEVIYRTLDDASGVTVIARRVGNSGPLKGKVYFKDVKFEKFIPELDTKIPHLSVNASKSADGKKVYLMVINKNMDEVMTSTIDLKDFAPAAKGNAWVLNGPSVDATNEEKHDNVKVTQHEFEIKGNPFEFTFEPHSLTAIEIKRGNH